MARILNLEAYPLATTISDNSYLIGTDATDNKETKNFKIEDLKTHILPAPLTPSGTFENATVVVDADGQISSVSQGASGSSKWSFSLGGNDIYRNSNVGIGDFSAADPAQALEVQGKVQVSGADSEFIGDINGAIRFSAKAGEALSKGDVVYISEIETSGNKPIVSKADASDSAKMPAFGLAFAAASINSSVEVITFGTLSSIDTSAFSLGDTVYVSTTAGQLTNTPPTGEANLLQNIGKVQRVQASSGSIKVGGAGRTNATPNLNEGSLFIGNSSNQSSTLAIGAASTFLKSDGTTASWATISEGEVNTASNVGEESELFKQKVGSDLEFRTLGANANISITQGSDTVSIGLTGVALVGTYNDGYVPRWNATTNTLESGSIRDDGATVSIGGNPSSSNTFFTTTNTLTTAIQGQIKNDRTSQTHAIRARNENGDASNNVFATAFLAESTPTSSTPSGGIYVAGRFIQGNFSEFGSTGTIDLTSIQTEVDTNVNSDNVYAIKVDKVDINNSVSGNVYGLYLESHTGFGIVSGSEYGIYQNGSDKNYLAGQLQLNHTSGTAGQFLKSADTSGNAEWSAISASDVTGAVTATTGVAQRVAVFDGTDSIEGDSNFTWDGSQIDVTDAQGNLAEVRADWVRVYNETDDANLFLYGYGSAHRGEIVLGAANGSRGNEEAINNGNTTATISSWGHNGTSFKNNAQIIFQATEDYTSTVNGTRYILQTVVNGSNTLSTRYATDGNGDHTFTGNVLVGGQAYSSIQPTTVAATSSTIDWNDGNVAVLELGGSTTDVTLTLDNPKEGAQYLIKIIQGASLVDVIFPSTVKFAGNTTQPYVLDVTATDNAIDAVALTCISDSGTVEYLANVSQNYG